MQQLPTIADTLFAGTFGFCSEVNGDLNVAFVVTGSGWDDANGFYASTGKFWHESLVFENDRECLICREPHRNRKSGQTGYGWILGQHGKPLYPSVSQNYITASFIFQLFDVKHHFIIVSLKHYFQDHISCPKSTSHISRAHHIWKHIKL